MSKLWAGRTDGETAALADEINNSIGVDCRLQRQDIEGSMAHARMLARQGIITEAEAAQITDGSEPETEEPAEAAEGTSTGLIGFDPMSESPEDLKLILHDLNYAEEDITFVRAE